MYLLYLKKSKLLFKSKNHEKSIKKYKKCKNYTIFWILFWKKVKKVQKSTKKVVKSKGYFLWKVVTTYSKLYFFYLPQVKKVPKSTISKWYVFLMSTILQAGLWCSDNLPSTTYTLTNWQLCSITQHQNQIASWNYGNLDAWQCGEMYWLLHALLLYPSFYYLWKYFPKTSSVFFSLSQPHASHSFILCRFWIQWQLSPVAPQVKSTFTLIPTESCEFGAWLTTRWLCAHCMCEWSWLNPTPPKRRPMTVAEDMPLVPFHWHARRTQAKSMFASSNVNASAPVCAGECYCRWSAYLPHWP